MTADDMKIRYACVFGTPAVRLRIGKRIRYVCVDLMASRDRFAALSLETVSTQFLWPLDRETFAYCANEPSLMSVGVFPLVEKKEEYSRLTKVDIGFPGLMSMLLAALR